MRRRSTKPYGGGRTDRPAGKFLDTRGNPSLGVGICGRCSFKFPLHMLLPDPNTPGLLVCQTDRDDFDPLRMAPRQPDRIQLPFTRPDTPLIVTNADEPDWLVTPDPTEPFPEDDPPR